MTIDLLILHFNRSDLTDACLAGCLAVGDEWRKVWVVDNGSDQTYNLPTGEARDCGRIEVLRSPKNLGFSGGINFGMPQVDEGPADAVLLLNNDATPTPGYIAGLAEFAAITPRAWMLTGPGWTGPNPADATTFEGPSILADRAPFSPKPQFASTGDLPTAPVQVQWATAAAVLVTRQAWQTVGAWDPKYFLYWEDMDFCARVAKASGQIWFLPHLRYHHLLNASSTDRPTQINYYFHRNQLRFLWKHDRGKIAGVLKYHFVWLRGRARADRTQADRARIAGVRDFLLGKTGNR